MTKVHSTKTNPFLRLMVTPDVYDANIETVVPVRRALEVPSTIVKIGKVLSHSGCVCKTPKGYILVEYMCDGMVYVSKVMKFQNGMDCFNFKNYHFILDTVTPQVPSRPVTIRQFTTKMIEFTKDKEFNTFTHNCHHARYDTMKFFGMKSDNPDAGKYNLFYQGFVDYFKKKKAPEASSSSASTSVPKNC